MPSCALGTKRENALSCGVAAADGLISPDDSRMDPLALNLIMIAGLFLLGAAGEMIFARTQVPDVVWLIVAGVVLNATGLVDPSALDDVLPLFVRVESLTISTPRVDVIGGRSGIASLGEGEHTLIFYSGDEEVGRKVVVLAPGAVTEVRP